MVAQARKRRIAGRPHLMGCLDDQQGHPLREVPAPWRDPSKVEA
jgi:hypothetical protein